MANRRTILTLEVYHDDEEFTADDLAMILNVGLDEVRESHFKTRDMHVNKFVPLSPWDMPPSIVHVPTVFECPTRFVLVDDYSGSNAVTEQHGQVDLEGNAHDNAVVLNLDGYGLKSMEAGFGGVVLLEHWAGETRLLVWADITEEEPTHTISLAGAKESRRLPEDD